MKRHGLTWLALAAAYGAGVINLIAGAQIGLCVVGVSSIASEFGVPLDSTRGYVLAFTHLLTAIALVDGGKRTVQRWRRFAPASLAIGAIGAVGLAIYWNQADDFADSWLTGPVPVVAAVAACTAVAITLTPPDGHGHAARTGPCELASKRRWWPASKLCADDDENEPHATSNTPGSPAARNL